MFQYILVYILLIALFYSETNRWHFCEILFMSVTICLTLQYWKVIITSCLYQHFIVN